MKNSITQFTGHIKHYQKHYLFGIFGGFAVFKLVLLLMGITFVQYASIHTKTFAELESGCVMRGQYFTGQYQTGCVDIPEALTGGQLIDCETISGYWTGETIDESGAPISQIWIEEETQTGCVLTGQEIVPAYTTGCYLTGGYRTGGTIVCTHEEESLEQAICTSGDITWRSPLSGTSVRDIFSFNWEYSGSDCVISGLEFQLLDHNNQWLDVARLASGATSVEFDSKKLYSFQQSGLYHIIGTNMSGNDYYVYTGTYTGSYSRFFSGYMARIVDLSGDVVSETSLFTIDNELPTLTGVSLQNNASSTGYLTSGVVTLSFVASELLSGVHVSLGSGKIPSTSRVSGFTHTYTWELNPLYNEGPLVATLYFADMAGNTGSRVYTSALIYDITAPTVTGFVFAKTLSGLLLDFLSSEAVRVDFDYQKNGTILTGKTPDYLTRPQLTFSDIEINELYTFTLHILDRANNTRVVTGDVMKTQTGEVISHIYIVSPVAPALLSGEVATLATVLQAEVKKYTVCKNALRYTPVELEVRRSTFTLQMPDFQKSQVKVLVNAFTLFVLDQVKHDTTLTTSDIDSITKKFDNFLVILKLLRDDDNSCKQNLSNYHISQFTRILEEFDIDLE